MRYRNHRNRSLHCHVSFHVALSQILKVAEIYLSGTALAKGGPGSLFIAFVIWSSFILAVNQCVGEFIACHIVAASTEMILSRDGDMDSNLCPLRTLYLFPGARIQCPHRSLGQICGPLRRPRDGILHWH